MKKMFTVLFFLITVSAFAQENVYAPQKFALVIGNGAYTGISRLNNPVNDAEDMAATLSALGFTVDKILNGSLEQMESAVMRLKNRLSVSRNTYGFFFYAGHGVQSNGENFLIPVDANIQSEGNIRVRSVSVQAMLDDLNDAGNELNVIVLDACRDNPFGWARSGTRGLSIVGRQPADSIIVYATSAGSTASDGTGRNGLFTNHLLNNIKTSDIDVNEVFRRTMGDVARASNNRQRPAIYSQFSEIAYLGSLPAGSVAAVRPTPQPSIAPRQPAPTPLPASPRQGPSNLGYGFMNLVFGLGSYLQGDTVGGVVTTAGYAASLGLIVWELNLTRHDALAGYLGPVGIGVAAATVVFGFVKPNMYSKVNVGLVSTQQNSTALSISYTHSF